MSTTTTTRPAHGSLGTYRAYSPVPTCDDCGTPLRDEEVRLCAGCGARREPEVEAFIARAVRRLTKRGEVIA